MTEALLDLHGHSRRVGLVEWHPTTNNILFSAGYDYKVWGPGMGQPTRAGSVRRDVAERAGGVDDSLSLLTGVIHLLSHSSNRLFTLRETEHLLCTFFFPGEPGALRHLSYLLWSFVD